jgi:hypothetical protein
MPPSATHMPTPVCPKRSANSFSSVCAIVLSAAALRSRAVSMSWLVDARSVPYWWWCDMVAGLIEGRRGQERGRDRQRERDRGDAAVLLLCCCCCPARLQALVDG